MLALCLLLCVAGLVATAFYGNQLYEKIYSDAMQAARVDIAREIEGACAYFARDPEAKLVLQIAADAILAGDMVDGERVHRKFAKRMGMFKGVANVEKHDRDANQA